MSAPFASAAVARAVALIPADDELADSDAGVETARERFELCAEEPFAEQPSIAACSGILITGDVLLTAGHCFEEGEGCDRYRYGLDYVQGDAGAAGPIVMSCAELITREVGELADGSAIDYALVRLERAAGPPAGLTVRSRAVEPGERLTSVGFPQGLPLKIDPEAEVVAAARTGFKLTTDAYLGSSGSALYDDHGALVGILTGGQRDFEWDAQRGCNRSRVIDDAGTDLSERALYAWVAIGRACEDHPELASCPVLDAGVDPPDESPIAEPMSHDPVVEDGGDSGVAGSKSVPAAPDASVDRPDDAGQLDEAAPARAPRSSGGCSATAGGRSMSLWLALIPIAFGGSARRRKR